MYRRSDRQIGTLDERVRDQALRRPGAKPFMTHPGVGTVTALTTGVFLGDPVKYSICRIVSVLLKTEHWFALCVFVDDEASVGESLSEKLSQQRFDCQTAPSGEEALEWTEHDSFDIIISDLRMPGWRCRPVGGVRTLPRTDYL